LKQKESAEAYELLLLPLIFLAVEWWRKNMAVIHRIPQQVTQQWMQAALYLLSLASHSPLSKSQCTVVRELDDLFPIFNQVL
jgi:hypothetical protein